MQIRLLLSLAGLAVSFAFPTLAQEQNAVDLEVRQQIEAAVTKYEDAFNQNDATAIAALYTADAAEVFEHKGAGGSSRKLQSNRACDGTRSGYQPVRRCPAQERDLPGRSCQLRSHIAPIWKKVRKFSARKAFVGIFCWEFFGGNWLRGEFLGVWLCASF